jgi:hypothetical protein
MYLLGLLQYSVPPSPATLQPEVVRQRQVPTILWRFLLLNTKFDTKQIK